MKTYDLVVLGTGPAASRVADKCAARDWNVAIVESREFGGTCALRGCNPKKVLVRGAELADWARRADGKLARSSSLKIVWPELIAFKREFTDPVKEKSEANYRSKGIETFSGVGSFEEPNVISVGNQRLKARHILVAVGAKPAPLDFPGSQYLMTSDAFLELESIPDRILFVGGGYISFEFAHVAARAGAEVTILDRGRPLSAFDPDLVHHLMLHSQEIGVQALPNSQVLEVERSESGYHVSANVAGTISTFSVDLVVHGAGRVPNLAGLELEAGHVDYDDERGILVNEFMQSVSNTSVFAAGDCAASSAPMLTPAASQQGRTIAQNLLDGKLDHTPDVTPSPTAVFTVPALAAVGISESAATEQGLDFEARSGEMSDWGSVRKVCGSCAHYKILVDRNTDRILGAHLLGPNAAETINLFALAMKFDLTATDVKSTLFVFPSFSADVRSML